MVIDYSKNFCKIGNQFCGEGVNIGGLKEMAGGSKSKGGLGLCLMNVIEKARDASSSYEAIQEKNPFNNFSILFRLVSLISSVAIANSNFSSSVFAKVNSRASLSLRIAPKV
jgi:hypothetical protein